MKLKQHAALHVSLIGQIVMVVNERTAVNDGKHQQRKFGPEEDVVHLLVEGGWDEGVAVGKVANAEGVRGKLSRQVDAPEVVVCRDFVALVCQVAVDGAEFAI